MKSISTLIQFAYLHKVYFEKELVPVAKEYHLKQSELGLLLMLHFNPNIKTATELCAITDMKRGNVSLIVEKMCCRGFLEQKTNENDRRNKYLVLTGEPEDLFKKCHEIMEKHYEQVMKGITQDELDFCENVFIKMYKNLVEESK